MIRRRKPIKRTWVSKRRAHMAGFASDGGEKGTLRWLADEVWREVIFSRDNWTCRRCKVPSVPVQAHHIISRARHSVRHRPENGVTLCVGCHFWVHRHLPAHETADFYAGLGCDYRKMYDLSRQSAKWKDLALEIVALKQELARLGGGRPCSRKRSCVVSPS